MYAPGRPRGLSGALYCVQKQKGYDLLHSGGTVRYDRQSILFPDAIPAGGGRRNCHELYAAWESGSAARVSVRYAVHLYDFEVKHFGEHSFDQIKPELFTVVNCC